MSPNDLLQMIRKYSITEKDAIDDVNDLISQVDNNYKDFIYKLSNEIEEYYLEKGICPLCGGDIIKIEKYTEDMGEYLGQPAKQDISVYGCERCNYVIT